MYVEVSGYEHTQLSDPKIGRSAIYIGKVERPPVFDPQRDTVSNVVREIDAKENQPTPVELDAGRYWLWASNAPVLRLSGCGVDSVTDPVASS